MNKNDLSICMIVKNEKQVINRSLKCAEQISNDIIVVDTGSTDNTKSIVKKYTKNIYDFEWIDDFSAARNFAFSKATNKYIMWLDADDIIPDASIEKIRNLETDVDIIMLPYHVGFDEHGNVTFSFSRERIIKRETNFTWREPIHEYIEISGEKIYLDIPIVHGHKKRDHSDRNLNIYRKRESVGAEFSSRALYYYARELHDNGFVEEAVKKYYEFLNRDDGWVEDRIGACIRLSECFEVDSQFSLQALYTSFIYDLPRPEVCCRIGNIYFNKDDNLKAIFWYEKALEAPKDESHGFVRKEYWGYIPHLQLCVCYDRIGNRDLAISHNELAGQINPSSKAYLYNRKYFEVV